MKQESLPICRRCPCMSINRIDGEHNLVRLHCDKVVFKENEFSISSYPFVTPELLEHGSMMYSKNINKLKESQWNNLKPVKKFEIPDECPYILEHVLSNEK